MDWTYHERLENGLDITEKYRNNRHRTRKTGNLFRRAMSKDKLMMRKDNK